MFFSDRNCKQRQMKLYEQLNLKDSMPLVSQDSDAFSYTYDLDPCVTTKAVRWYQYQSWLA